jgi:hypothetical protein
MAEEKKLLIRKLDHSMRRRMKVSGKRPSMGERKGKEK